MHAFVFTLVHSNNDLSGIHKFEQNLKKYYSRQRKTQGHEIKLNLSHKVNI